MNEFQFEDLKINDVFRDFAILSYTDIDGTIVYASDLFCQISQYSRDELIGQNHRLLRSGEHSTSYYKEIWEVILGGKVWHGRICNKKKNGDHYWVESTIFPVYRDGNIIGFGSFRIDITEQVQKEKELDSSIYFSKLIMDNVVEGIVIQDKKSTIIEMNQACPKILGLTRNQMLGMDSFDPTWRTVNEDLTPCPGEYHPSSIAMATKSNVYDRIMGVTLPDGSIRWLKINSVFYIDPLNGEDRTITSFSDVTSLKEQERKLAQSAQLAAIGETTANIAHEISNPLSIITMGMDLIKSSLIDEKSKELDKKFELIYKANSRIQKIIKGLKAASRMGFADPMLDVCLKDIMEDILSLTELKIKNKSIKLEVDKVDGQIHGRSYQVIQILLNLINNAIDSLESLVGKEKFIKILIKSDEHFHYISIQDNGPGVDERMQSMIFQSQITTKNVGKGTGLGLSIAKKLAKEHNGDLYLESPSNPTTFTLKLPKV